MAAITNNTATSSIYSTTIWHEALELIETSNSYPISNQQKEIIQAVWLGHVQKVEALLSSQPTLINIQFKANVIKFSVPEEEEGSLDQYHFSCPKQTLTQEVDALGIFNLQHLACHKMNLKMALLIHRLQPTLFFHATPGLEDSPLELLVRDKHTDLTLPFFNGWLRSGTLDDYLFHHYKHLHLADTMIRNSHLFGLKLILQRACDLYINQVNQLLIESQPRDIGNLITSYCESYITLQDSSPIDCPMIQTNIHTMIHPVDQKEDPYPLLSTAIYFSGNANIIKLLLRCGADPDQPMTITYNNGSTQTHSVRYFGNEERQKEVASIFKSLGKGTPAPHSIRRETAPIIKLKTKSKVCCIS